MKKLLFALAIIASLNACEKEKVTTVDQAAINQANAKLVGAWKNSTVEVHVDSKVYSATIDEISNADSLSTVHHDTINFIADGTYNRFFKYFEGTYTVTNDLKGIKFVNKMPQNGAIVSLEIKYSFEKNETLLKLLTSELTEKKENEGVDVEILREKMEDIVKLKGGEEALKSYKVLKMYIIHKKIK